LAATGQSAADFLAAVADAHLALGLDEGGAVLGPILQNFISAENFWDTFSYSHFGQIPAKKNQHYKLI
jgi:hypothetical protein